MATPSGPTISMDNMRAEITRSTGSVSMQEIRTRAGRSGAISFSQMYKCEGWVQTNGSYTSKYFSFYGWAPFWGAGSVSPNEGNNRIVITTTPSPGTSLIGFYSATGGVIVDLANSTYGGNTVASGYRAQDITRLVAENVARTGTSSSNTEWRIEPGTYAVANTGTIHCMIQF